MARTLQVLSNPLSVCASMSMFDARDPIGKCLQCVDWCHHR